MARIAIATVLPLIFAEEAPTSAMLRGSKLARSLGDLPSCAGKPNFQLAHSAWCGQQQEPVACFKDEGSSNPIWDCHLQTDGWCTIDGQACAWPIGSEPLEPAPAPVQDPEATRFVTWNLYVFTLAGRIHPVVDELMRMQPEIAAIPEMWSEKDAILDRLNQVSGNIYEFATGGATEQFNDADILFRSDKWEHIASDLVPFSAGRAVNWAALRRKSDGYTLLAAGTHPLCCKGDNVIIEAVDFVIRTLSEVQKEHPYPIFLSVFGVLPSEDYVYFQKTPITVGQSIVQSQIWPRSAGSDHRAVSGDIVLR
eukprot:Skav234124  [mRNA]  locus=scaffold753:104425:106917:- [translate_table: standard]